MFECSLKKGLMHILPSVLTSLSEPHLSTLVTKENPSGNYSVVEDSDRL